MVVPHEPGLDRCEIVQQGRDKIVIFDESAIKFSKPKRLCNCFLSLGVGQSRTAETFAKSMENLLGEMLKPRN